MRGYAQLNYKDLCIIEMHDDHESKMVLTFNGNHKFKGESVLNKHEERGVVIFFQSQKGNALFGGKFKSRMERPFLYFSTVVILTICLLFTIPGITVLLA